MPIDRLARRWGAREKDIEQEVRATPQEISYPERQQRGQDAADPRLGTAGEGEMVKA